MVHAVQATTFINEQQQHDSAKNRNDSDDSSNPILHLLSPQPTPDFRLGIQPLEMSWAIRTQIPRYMQSRPPLIPFTISRVMFPLFILIPPRVMFNVRSNTRVEVL